MTSSYLRRRPAPFRILFSNHDRHTIDLILNGVDNTLQTLLNLLHISSKAVFKCTCGRTDPNVTTSHQLRWRRQGTLKDSAFGFYLSRNLLERLPPGIRHHL